MPTTVLKLVNYQVVNGGQTLKSVHKFIEENVDKDPYGVVSSLREASVLVRAYSVGASDEDDEDVHANGKAYSVGTQIARFTNSQNAINPADLHSNDAWQIKLKNISMVSSMNIFLSVVMFLKRKRMANVLCLWN